MFCAQTQKQTSTVQEWIAITSWYCVTVLPVPQHPWFVTFQMWDLVISKGEQCVLQLGKLQRFSLEWLQFRGKHFSLSRLWKEVAFERQHVPAVNLDSRFSNSWCCFFFQSGLIRTQKIEFLISPLPQQLAQEHNYTSPAGHHPHVLYKRTAEEKVYRYTAQAKPKHFPSGHHRIHTSHKYHAQANGYHHGRFQKQHFCGRRKKCM